MSARDVVLASLNDRAAKLRQAADAAEGAYQGAWAPAMERLAGYYREAASVLERAARTEREEA